MKSYYLTNHYKYLYLAKAISSIIVAVAVMFIILWHFDISRQMSVVAFVPIVYGMYSIYYLIVYYTKKHIIVDEKGIEYKSPSVNFLAKWNVIEKISFGWHEQVKQEGIVVDKMRLETQNSFRQIPAKNYFPSNSIKGFIPLSCFSEDWHNSELGQQIRQYAPHLFEKEKSV